jgi:hypothetical protein
MHPQCSSAFLATLAIVISACGSTTLTQTGPAQREKVASCDFKMLTAAPSGGFSEVGVVDVTPSGFGFNVYRELSEFKRGIQPLVCKAGGDAAIAHANGFGMYIKATILKMVAIAPQPSDRGTAPTVGGCQYDSQCKGDRICVSGQCTTPDVKR